MSAPLSHRQKMILSQLSDRAYDRAAAAADGAAFYDGFTPARAREEFRHDQVAAACGKLGLRCCGQDDYKLVEAHFLALLGETRRAFEAGIAAATEPRRQAEAVLARECARFGLQLSYPAAICRRQFRCELADAAPNQLWSLIFTVRNRGRARARKTISGGGRHSTSEPPAPTVSAPGLAAGKP